MGLLLGQLLKISKNPSVVFQNHQIEDLAWKNFHSKWIRNFRSNSSLLGTQESIVQFQTDSVFLDLPEKKNLVTPLLLCRKALHIQLHSILKNDLIIIDQSSLLSIFTVLRKINQLLYVPTGLFVQFIQKVCNVIMYV